MSDFVSPGGNQVSRIFACQRSRERLVTHLLLRPEELVERDKRGCRLLGDIRDVITLLSASTPIAAQLRAAVPAGELAVAGLLAGNLTMREPTMTCVSTNLVI